MSAQKLRQYMYIYANSSLSLQSILKLWNQVNFIQYIVAKIELKITTSVENTYHFESNNFFFSFSVIAKRLISIKFPLRKIKWFYLSYHIDCMLDCHTSYCIFHRYIHRNLIHKSIVFPFFSRPLLPLMQRLTRPISLPVWWCFFFIVVWRIRKKNRLH